MTVTMSDSQLAEAASPGASPSIVRMIARIKREDPYGWRALRAEMAGTDRAVPIEPESARTWSLAAESVRLAFVSYAEIQSVASRLLVSRATIYDHLKTLSETFEIERKRVGPRLQFRIGSRKAA